MQQKCFQKFTEQVLVACKLKYENMNKAEMKCKGVTYLSEEEAIV